MPNHTHPPLPHTFAVPHARAAARLALCRYIKMLGADGMRRATGHAILNANYMAHKLGDAFNVLFKGTNGQCAHEFIIDLRPFKESAGVSEEDVAKRLQVGRSRAV